MKSVHFALLPFLLAATVFLAGCQTWTRGGEHKSSQGYTVVTPTDWIHHPNYGGGFMATKDGLFLQRLTVRRQLLTTPLAHNKRALAASLSPYELAETLIDDLKADRRLHGLAITENAPSRLGGKDAVRLVFNYRNDDALLVTASRIAGIHGDYLYVLSLEAPDRHYFSAARPALDQAISSFVFTDSGTASK